MHTQPSTSQNRSIDVNLPMHQHIKPSVPWRVVLLSEASLDGPAAAAGPRAAVSG